MITKLKLRNFTCFSNKEFEFKRFNIIVGKNGSGKSSILDAILYVLTNRAFRIRRYIEELIQYNKNEMSASIQIGNYEISRGRKRGLEHKTDLMLPRTKKEIKKRAQEIYEQGFTNFSIKDLNSGQLIEIYNQADLKRFISSLLNVNPEFVDYTKIIKFSYFKSDHLIKFHPIDLIEDLFFDIEKIKEQIHKFIDEYSNNLAQFNNQLYHFQEVLKLFPEGKLSDYIENKDNFKKQVQKLEINKKDLLHKIAELTTLTKLIQKLIQDKICPVCSTKFPDISQFSNDLTNYEHNILDYQKDLDKISAQISELNNLIIEFEKKISLFENLPDKLELEKSIKQLSEKTLELTDKIKILKILDKNFLRFKTEIYSSFLNKNQNLIVQIFYELFEEIASLKIVPASEILLYFVKDGNQIEYQNLSTSEKIKVNLVITFLIIMTYWNLSIPFLFYDEIFDHLDKFNFQKILAFFVFNKLFKNMKQQKQIFLITHRIEDIKEISDLPDTNIILLDR